MQLSQIQSALECLIDDMESTEIGEMLKVDGGVVIFTEALVLVHQALDKIKSIKGNKKEVSKC